MGRMLGKWRALVGATALILLVCVSNAEAISGVRISPGREFTTTGTLFVNEFTNTNCNVTLRGSFSASLLAIAGEGTQIGSLTGLGGCTGSSVAILNLPLPIRVQEIDGANPRYAGADSVGVMSWPVSALAFNVRTCLVTRRFELYAIFTRTGANEFTVREIVGFVSMCYGGEMLAQFTLGAPSPRQTFTFLTGNEVINGPTPNPLDFGSVGVGELAQRTVTIGAASGGMIVEIATTTGRYFAITDPNGCRGTVLSAGATCNVNAIVSAPTEAGRAVSDTLTVRLGGTRYETTLRATT